MFNNITVNNSQVGVINTGDIKHIDAAITLSKGSDTEAFGNALARFTQAVVDAQDIDVQHRQQILDVLRALAENVVRERKPAVVKALWEAVASKAAPATSLAAAFVELASAVKDFLQ